MEQNLRGDRGNGTKIMVEEINSRWLIDAQAKSVYKPGKFYLIFLFFYTDIYTIWEWKR